MNRTFDFCNARIVNGERVRQAREMAGLTQSDLAENTCVSQAMIAHIEKGLKQPSGELAEAIARETMVLTEFLYRPTGPFLPEGSLLFRARASVSAKKLSQTHALAERVFEMFTEMAGKFNLPPVKIRPVQGRPGSAAIEARRMLGLSVDRPIPHLIRAFERAGGVVITIPELEGREAFAVWASDHPVVALGPTTSGDRLRFSMAHEIGHLLMHQAPTARAQAENDAHTFAAELLTPHAAIEKDFALGLSIERLGRLKQKWGISMAALLRRAKELGAISRRNYERFVKEMAAMGMRTKEPDEFAIPIEKPRALRQMAEALYGKGLRFDHISKDFGLPSSFVEEVLQRYASSAEVHQPSKNLKVVNITSHLEMRKAD